MKTKKLYLLFGLPLIAFNVSVRGQPFVDGKAYPGALCQPETNTQSILRNIKGVMFNTGTEPQNWICPIVRDRELSSLEGAFIVVRDKNAVEGDPNADVSCTLFSMTPTGQLVASETQRSAGTGVMRLEYGADGSVINSQPHGYYYFMCTIPGTSEGLSSGVVEYLVVENL
jgi:hypothetical protein